MLTASGSNAEEAQIVSDHLVDANLAGHDSHGVGLLPMYMNDRRNNKVHANAHAQLERDDGPIGIFDGNMGFGHVLAREATLWGIEKARAGGTAIVALRNAYHIARVGTYAEIACAANLISIFFVNVVFGAQRVAVFGGTDGRLHTNPICIAVPGNNSHPPFILDFATSKIAIGKVRVAYNEKRQLPLGTIIDAKGAPSTDPAVIYEEPQGAILPFGEHKGSGLAVMCELLAGALVGGITNQASTPQDRGLTNNMLSILIDPQRFTSDTIFHHEIEAILKHVTDSPAADPAHPVVTAGEPERQSRARRLEQGIPIDAVTWAGIVAAAKSVGVTA
jgi:uncharacterized oxidoreductase